MKSALHASRATSRRREGFALPAVTGALVIIGIIVTAGFYTARQELRIGVASRNAAMATNIAQAGLNEVMANWNGYELGNIPVWQDTTLTGTAGSGEWSVTITNRNNFVFDLAGTGEVTEGGSLWSGANRRVGIVAKLVFAELMPPAALTTRGTTNILGTVDIIGTNFTPSAWAPYCSGFTAGDTTGVLMSDASSISGAGAASVIGDPPTVNDPAIVDETFTTFGDMNWSDLRLLAQLEGKDVSALPAVVNQTLPDTLSNGVCNEATLTNWGDTIPTNPCGSYFPLIYVNHSITINGGGMGQGILLVEGDLELSGGFLFYGLIITQGELRTYGAGARLVGAVMASNSALSDNQTFGGGSEIQYSYCTVMRAVLNNSSLSRARPLPERGWVDISSVVN